MGLKPRSLLRGSLLCFIYHRYQKYQDHLIITLLHQVKKYQDASWIMAQQAVYEQQITYTKNLKKAGEVLQLLTNSQVFPDDISVGRLRD